MCDRIDTTGRGANRTAAYAASGSSTDSSSGAATGPRTRRMVDATVTSAASVNSAATAKISSRPWTRTPRVRAERDGTGAPQLGMAGHGSEDRDEHGQAERRADLLA